MDVKTENGKKMVELQELNYNGYQCHYYIYQGEYINSAPHDRNERTGSKTLTGYKRWLARSL